MGRQPTTRPEPTPPDEAVFHHGTLSMRDGHGENASRFARFRALTHFGSLRAAMERAANVAAKRGWQYRPDLGDGHPDLPVFLYPVRLSVRRPLRIRDTRNGLHSPVLLADMLHYTMRGAISDSERCAVLAASADQAPGVLAGILRGKGFDGMVYRNRHEDAGRDSWIILDGSQAVDAGQVAAMTYGELRAQWFLLHGQANAVQAPANGCGAGKPLASA